MKLKSAKFWLKVLAVAVAGIALVCTYVVATGGMMSREASESYEIKDITSLQFDTVRAQVTYLPTEDTQQLQVYAKAWLSEPIDLSKRLSMKTEGTVLTVKEIPFESTFFGFFPQPYEMTITAYVPEAVYQSITGGTP